MSNFTSRLPMSTIRRPTNASTGSTSFVGHRPSNIPVTVRKANLFTPQTKRPTLSGASTAGKSYMSGMTTDKKYKRALKPAPERDEQIKMFNRLVEFIKAHAPNVSPPDPKKFFSSISTTESSRIFELLIGTILPDFKITRLETDVPEALTLLEYPYIRSVTKSALVSVTTRQAVVGLLVIFNWLIDSIETCNGTSFLDVGGDEQVDVQLELTKITLTHPPEKREEVLLRLFKSIYPDTDNHRLNEDLEELNRECEELAAENEELEELDQELQTFEEDLKRCEKYELEMESYIQNKKLEEEKAERNSALLDQQIMQLNREISEVRSELNRQPIDLDELKSIQSEHLAIEKELQGVRERFAKKRTEGKALSELREAAETRLLTKIGEVLNQMKEVSNICDSTELDSETRTKLKVASSKWTQSLEQLIREPPGNVISYQETFKGLKLFNEALRGSSVSLKKEFTDMLLDEKEGLHRLEEENRKLENDIVPHLELAIQRKECDMKREREVDENQLVEIEAQINAENIKFNSLNDKFNIEESELKERLKISQERLRQGQKDLVGQTKLNREHLESLIKLNSYQTEETRLEAQRTRDRVKLDCEKHKEMSRAAKSGLKLVRRRLGN